MNFAKTNDKTCRLIFFLLAFVSLSFCKSDFCLANQISFAIGHDVQGFNVPFVSITICLPGTKTCRTIPRIKLDTGSEGLKLYKSALQGLDLPLEQDREGNTLALCANMGGGNGYWGPISTVDLVLGDEPAPAAKIQIVDPSFSASAKIPCAPLVNDGRNGTLGMDTALGSINGKSYFYCGAAGCTTTTPLSAQQALNPMAYLTEDNNGFIVKTPAVPITGEANLVGSVIFGIGNHANNQLPAGLTACHVRSDDFFQLQFGGGTYWTKFDSGTNAYNLPSSNANLPFCQNSSVYLCPAQPTNLHVDLLNFDGSACGGLDFTIRRNFDGPGSSQNSWVLPGLAEIWEGRTSHSFLLGVPFFFGKDIYYGLDHKISPLGAGPLVAF